jgi:hypothetical protein
MKDRSFFKISSFCKSLVFVIISFISISAITNNASLLSTLHSNQKSEKTKSEYSNDFGLLPNGETFAFWDDQTKYKKIIHVAQNHPKASDKNPGTAERPLKTINTAAQLLHPGEKVIVHEGIYRECVQPLRGGTSAKNMIAYEVANGDQVIVKGSESWDPQFVTSTGWRMGSPNDSIKVLMADIPERLFKAYNPFLVRNVYREIINYGKTSEPEWMKRAMLYRGSVFVNGKPFKQVYGPEDLLQIENAFWVEEPGLRLHLSFAKKVDPSKLSFEITAREQIFAPRKFGLEYIRISGFDFEHAADEIPVPQRAAVSATRGHYWIIENNRIEWVNGTGIDIGNQTWDADKWEILGGGHIVRNNTIRNIGICGIAGPSLNHTLIENNLIENVGYLNLERCAETAGIKFHGCHNTLIRQNIIRHVTHASAIWLDISATNCRITNNVMADIQSMLGCLFMEINLDPNLIDHNIFWDIRNDLNLDKNLPLPTEWNYGDGAAIRSDCNDQLIIANNFFGKVDEYAVSLNSFQSKRIVDGRAGLNYANKVLNNLFFDCNKRLYVSKKLENIIDGNLYDKKNDRGSFILVYPEPWTFQNLAGWKDFFGFDKHSTQAGIEADFDIKTGKLVVKIDGDLPKCQNLNSVMNGNITSSFSGPFSIDVIQKSQKTVKVEQKFPL